ncbi:MAG: Gfo/Idh/MocA family oxidoreductase [Defluviitaleaceae bacterium]|nr:Gfo/Idh/MocA family oxidoreductase [Defluviitaleaceae bacterium]
MDKVKLGVIGLGLAWERLHAPALARLGDKFEIVAVCDLNETKATEVAVFLGLHHSAACSDYRRLLARPDIEAAVCLVPIEENFQVAQAAILAGKHVITEKPLAATPAEGELLIELKNSHRIQMMVAENIRYEEENTLIKSLISDKTIGDVVYFIDNHIVEFAQQAKTGGFAQTDWRQHPGFAGGVLLDSGVHHIARMRYFFGEVKTIAAAGRPSHENFSPYSCVNALLAFGDNITGHYSFFVEGQETQAPLVGLRIFGSQGQIYLEGRGCGFVNLSCKGSHTAIPYTPSQGYFHEYQNFHAALRLGQEITSTPEKALGDLETIFSLMDAITTEQALTLPRKKIATQVFFPSGAPANSY